MYSFYFECSLFKKNIKLTLLSCITFLWNIFILLFSLPTEAIDKFLLIADDNNDGLLHYPEFVKAITGGKEQLNVDRNILR